MHLYSDIVSLKNTYSEVIRVVPDSVGLVSLEEEYIWTQTCIEERWCEDTEDYRLSMSRREA